MRPNEPADAGIGPHPLLKTGSPLYLGENNTSKYQNVTITNIYISTAGFQAFYNNGLTTNDGVYVDGNTCVDPKNKQNGVKLVLHGATYVTTTGNNASPRFQVNGSNVEVPFSN